MAMAEKRSGKAKKAADNIVREGAGNWDKLVKMWLAEGKPGFVLSGGVQYRVIGGSRADVIFKPMSQITDGYGSLSTTTLPKRKAHA